jgi:beta-galactosidase
VKYTRVVDLFRLAKPGAAIYQAQVDPRVRPVMAPAFYWDFGAVSPVTSLPRAMICANTDRLELYVGGVHLCTARPDTGDYGRMAYPPSFVDFRRVDGSSRPDLRI